MFWKISILICVCFNELIFFEVTKNLRRIFEARAGSRFIEWQRVPVYFYSVSKRLKDTVGASSIKYHFRTNLRTRHMHTD